MTNERAMKLMEFYKLAAQLNYEWSSNPQVKYVIDMIDRVNRDFSVEKMQRWLGFIQGSLWSAGVHTVGELAQHVKHGWDEEISTEMG